MISGLKTRDMSREATKYQVMSYTLLVSGLFMGFVDDKKHIHTTSQYQALVRKPKQNKKSLICRNVT